MATSTQLATWISEAETARHKVMTHGQAELVQRDGRKVQYTKLTLEDLNGYLRTLRREYDEAVASEGSKQGRSAIKVEF